MPRHARRLMAVRSVVILLAVVAASCHSNPAQPTPAPTPPALKGDLEHFEPLVGTSWTGVARFTTVGGGSATSPASLVFLWRGICDIRDQYFQTWCSQGYGPFGWGTTGAVATNIIGSLDANLSGVSVQTRTVIIGEGPAGGAGHWDSARVGDDGRTLVIVSSDFSWGPRRGVTFELSRAPWPPDVNCPAFRTCQ